LEEAGTNCGNRKVVFLSSRITCEEKLLDGARRAALLQCEMEREVSDEIASIKSGPKSVNTRRVYSGGMESLQ